MRPATRWTRLVLCITVAGATHLSAQTRLRVVDSVAVDRGNVIVSTDASGQMTIAAATSTGRFTVRADQRMAAAWADNAAAATGPVLSSTDLQYNGARLTQIDPLINATRIMELFRLTTDSASPYALTASNGAWSGDLTLSDSAARHLFAVLRGQPRPIARRARDSVQSGSRDLVFFGFQVERQARSDVLVQPDYPETLQREGVQGGGRARGHPEVDVSSGDDCEPSGEAAGAGTVHVSNSAISSSAMMHRRGV